MTKTKTDNKTLELIKEVSKQRAEISKAEKSNWVTNCSFSYTENSANIINIHVESNIRNLVCIVSFLLEKEHYYNEAIVRLGVDAPSFSWCGFRVSDWISDIQTRINKIQIASKRKKLDALETRLNSIISPELRAQMELELIENELK